jgi:tetratricopeptide (TPR) repeat protein
VDMWQNNLDTQERAPYTSHQKVFINQHHEMDEQTRPEQNLEIKPASILADRNFKYTLLGFVILFLVILYVYYPSFQFDFIYDDFIVIKNQKPFAGFHDVVRMFQERHYPGLPYYRPIVRTTLLLQKTIHGDNAAPFHQFNVFLLWIAAIGVYWLLRQPQLNVPRPLAFIVTGIFALHPVSSACVYPIASGRETLLPGIFMILAIASYLKKGDVWYFLTFIFFTLALFSKEQALMLLPLFVTGDLIRMKNDPSLKEIRYWIKRYTLIIIVLFIYMQIRFSLFGGSEFAITIFKDPFKPFFSPLYALQSIFAPFRDEVYEPVQVKFWLSMPRLIIAIISVLALSFGIYKYIDRGRFLFIFWGAWFVLSMLPTANVIVQETAFSERYIFQSYLALLIVIAFILAQKWNNKITKQIIIISGLIIITILANFTMNRGNFFVGGFEFYTQWITVNPDHPAPYLGLSKIYVQKGDFVRAFDYSSKAIMLKPDYMSAIVHHTIIQGIISGESGEYKKAVEYFSRALFLNPNSIDAHYNFGIFYLKNKKHDFAIREFMKCIELDPRNADAHYNLGIIYELKGQKSLSSIYYRKAYSVY